MAAYFLLLNWKLDCEPSTKFILVKWVKRYGVHGAVNGPIKRIAAELSVSDRAAATALSWMVSHGWLEKITPVANKRGRPGHQYRYAGPALESATDPRYRRQIDSLLEAGKGVFGMVEKEGLDQKDRLLLSVLLFHADMCGVVRGFGRSQLAALTCMSKQTLARRVRKLGAKEYIRSYVPGVRGVHLFGEASGMYFLNLGAPALRSLAGPELIILFDVGLGAGRESPEGIQMFRLADGLSRDIEKGREHIMRNRFAGVEDVLACDQSFVELLPLFEEGGGSIDVSSSDSVSVTVAWYLQRRIEGYASEMLSLRWKELSAGEVVDLPDLMTRIKTDLCPDRATCEDAEAPRDEQAYERLASVVYFTSQKLARRLHKAMQVIPDVDFSSMNHTIMPFSRTIPWAYFRSIVSSPKEGVRLGEGHSGVVQVRPAPGKPQGLEIEWLGEEADLGPGRRGRAGLAFHAPPIRDRKSATDVT